MTTTQQKKPTPKKTRDDDGGSRERLIEATAILLRRQGYAATGLSQITDEACAPKGSLYFHFPGGKEELAAAALDRSAERFRNAIEAVLDSDADLVVAIGTVVDVLAAELVASGFKDGCPLATVALEVAADDGPLSTLCRLSFDRWEAAIADRLRRAGRSFEDAADDAHFVLSAIEGALMLARIHKSVEPLRATGRRLSGLIGLITPAPAQGQQS